MKFEALERLMELMQYCNDTSFVADEKLFFMSYEALLYH